jgi:hypothetical protein
MRTTLRRIAGTALAAALAAGLPAGVAAATPSGPAPVTTATPPPDPGPAGFDVSYPQCGSLLPTGQAFGVVGVDGGLPTTPNPCLAEQLVWAAGSTGTVPGQPGLQLYLNTANPGQVRQEVSTWPARGGTPYGACDGGNSRACSWQYGWERAEQSVTGIFGPAAQRAGIDPAPGSWTWWLDVETANTWQVGSSGARARNRAALEGMTAYLTTRGARVGLYSTGRQWAQIVGDLPRSSPLRHLPSWLAGASSAAEARDACDDDPLVPRSDVVLAQYVTGAVDGDVSCG